MITLYVKTGCPFCGKAITALNAHKVAYEEKNLADSGVVDELISLGGKRQVPFLVDGDTMMYESKSIVDYIEEKYHQDGEVVQNKPRVHFVKGDDVCPS